MRIDIDAARAARLEAEGEPHELVVGGKTYEIPPEAPWRFVHYLARNQIGPCMAAVVGEDGWVQMSKDVSHADVTELVDQLCNVWGLGDAGEADASGSSSPDGGSSSRPTSSGTTAST